MFDSASSGYDPDIDGPIVDAVTAAARNLYTSSLHLDFETYCDIDLKIRGLDNYMSHPSCRPLMLSWAFDDEAPRLWLPHLTPTLPHRLLHGLRNPAIVKKAWNAQFERIHFKRVMGIDIPAEQWQCTMVRSFMLSLPGALDDCGKVLNLGPEHQKSSEGRALIQLFCKPHKPTKKFPGKGDGSLVIYDHTTHPKEWKTFCAYCIQDTISERKIDKILSRFPIPPRQWKVYALDQKINERGVPLDLQFIRNAVSMMARRRAEIATEINKLTGLPNGNSVQQLLPWLRERGYPFSSLKKDRIKKALEDFYDNIEPEARKALELRLIAAKTSNRKFTTMLRLVGADGRLRFAFQMAGAGRTNRWAGRGVQLQNMPRPAKEYERFLAEIREFVLDNDYEGIKTFFGDPILVLSSSVRTAVAAHERKNLVVADLGAIETRLTGYISGCEALNEIFRKKLCPYITFASLLYNKPYNSITKRERQDNKPPMLGCGYGLSGGKEVGTYPDTTKVGLWGYAENMGVRITQQQAKDQVKFYRKTYHEVKALWASLVAGAVKTVETGKPTKVSVVEFDMMKPFLRMKLPSGRYVYYLRPKIVTQTVEYERDDGTIGSFFSTGITYEGKNSVGQWATLHTHGGKFVEQYCQADAYDILCDGLFEADDLGYFIVLHIHDEIGAEELEWDIEHDVSRLCAAMIKGSPDRPGLMLDAAGYENKFHKKD